MGISALLIASKYEEIYMPEVKEYAEVTGGAYTVSQVLKMESEILAYFKFDLSFGSFLQFYSRYAMFN